MAIGPWSVRLRSMLALPARRAAWRPAALVLAVAALPLPAAAVIEPDFERGTGPARTTWYGPSDPAAIEADRAYIAGMRPHHAGALAMSQEYLQDPAASSPMLRGLARAIVVNQQFEVLLLDEVSRNLERPPIALPFGITLRQVATEGLAQAMLFRREPMPGPIGWAMTPVSERDVQFAKAMTVHHQGAIDMARAYHANAAARNGFLGLFNVDIVTDQSQEIGLMRWVMSAYPGDLAAVAIDPAMVQGMEGMAGHGAHAAPARPAATPPQEDHSQHKH